VNRDPPTSKSLVWVYLPKQRFLSVFVNTLAGTQFHSDIPTFGPYIAKLSRNNYIDAKQSGCLGRYANHSCCPNARLQMVVKEVRKVGRKRGQKLTKEDIVTVDTLWIVADRTILEGEVIQRL
jgi:hypothetical protein